jgi:hypothetical protein
MRFKLADHPADIALARGSFKSILAVGFKRITFPESDATNAPLAVTDFVPRTITAPEAVHAPLI